MSKAALSSQDRDLWSLLARDVKLTTSASSAASSNEAVVLVVGDFKAGKSTIIQSFLKPNAGKEPKPTFALEYSFARKKSASSGKSVAHIWELGGEISDPGFLQVPITMRTLNDAAILICCDLSKPQNIYSTLKYYYENMKQIIRQYIADMQRLSWDTKISQLRQYASRPINEGTHPDSQKLRLLEIPNFIILTKYDVFKNLPLADRRLVYQIVRFFAHYYGASILTYTSDANQKESFRTYFSSICFQTPLKSIYEVSSDKPLFVSHGNDTFENILLGRKGIDDNKVNMIFIFHPIFDMLYVTRVYSKRNCCHLRMMPKDSLHPKGSLWMPGRGT